MKIVTWNCNGAFRNKTQEMDRLGADILIIQECENPAESTEQYRIWAGNNYLWTGESKHKGLGIFPKKGNVVEVIRWNSDFKISGLPSSSRALSWSTNELKLFLPFVVNSEFTVLSVWTKANKSNEIFGYIGQFWKYLQIHRNELAKSRTIIVGDFNSNSIWDQPDRWWNHSDVVKELKAINLESIYHHQFQETQGQETRPTFFLHRNEKKPYHIDYAFASSDLINDCKLEVGIHDEWLCFSDHMPLRLTIK